MNKPKKVAVKLVPNNDAKINGLVLELEGFLNDPKKFVTSENSYHHENNPPSNIIIELNRLNYEFTQDQFNRFVKCCVYGKKKSFCSNYKNRRQEDAVRIMFTKFEPSNVKVKAMFACINENATQNSLQIVYTWVDTLFNHEYEFTEDQKQLLVKCRYNIAKIIGDDVLDIAGLEELMSNSKQIVDDNFIQLIIKNNLVPTTKCLELFTKKLGYADIYRQDRLKNGDIEPNKETNHAYKYIKKIIDLGAVPSDDCFVNVLCDNSSYFFRGMYMFDVGTLIIDNIQKMSQNVFLGRLRNTLTKSLCYYILEKNKTDLDVNLLNELLLLDFSLNKEEFVRVNKKDVYQSFDIFKYLVWEKHITPTQDTLKIVCLKKKLELFDILTEIYKMTPDKKCLDNALFNCCREDKILIEKILQYKIIPDRISFYELCGFTMHTNGQIISSGSMYRNEQVGQILELLITYGLHITEEIYGIIIEHKIYLNNIERFGLVFNENIYFICHSCNNWPIHSSKFNIDPKITNMRDIAKRCSVDDFKKYLSENNLKPDRYCVENACLCRNFFLSEWLLRIINYDATPKALIYHELGLKSNLSLTGKKLLANLNIKCNITSETMAQQYEQDFSVNF